MADTPMIHHLTSEPVTRLDQVRQGEIYRVQCDDGVTRMGAFAFDNNGDWIFFPADRLRRPITDFAPPRRRAARKEPR